MSENRFPDRFAGSNFRPLVVLYKTESGGAFNMTGATGTFTIRKDRGAVAVVDAGAHTNTPTTTGRLEYQAAAADLQSPGDYTVTVIATMPTGQTDVSRFALTILPAV